MTKLTPENICEIYNESILDAYPDKQPRPLLEHNETDQEVFKNMAKRVNDYLIYGHLPKKESK